MDSKAVRWGILSTGQMARKFAENLRYARGARLVAVAARERGRAEAFGSEFDVTRCYGSYAQLMADPDVDVVYIATPNNLHKAHALMALDAGKAVLCEKPFATNAREAAAMVARARERRLFLMEAMWSRFMPVMATLREWLACGVLGEVRLLTADFGFRATGEALTEILTQPAFGGGSLLDVGVYPIQLASMLFGQAQRVATLAHMGKTGVDEEAGMILGYPGGELAMLLSAIRTTTSHEATIMGTQRRVRIHPPFWCASKVTLFEEERVVRTIEAPFEGDGYQFEAEEVMRCLREGRLESATMPLDESIAIMATLDRIRAQWGLRYPADDEA